MDARRLRFHPLGIDHPLVTLTRTETDLTSLATPLNVPMRIARRALHERRVDYCGHSLRLYAGTADPLPEVPAAAICACNLSDDGASWANLPAAGVYAVDPVLDSSIVGSLSVSEDGPAVVVSSTALPVDSTLVVVEVSSSAPVSTELCSRLAPSSVASVTESPPLVVGEVPVVPSSSTHSPARSSPARSP